MLAPVVVRPGELLAAVPAARAITLAVRLRQLPYRAAEAPADGIPAAASMPGTASGLPTASG